MVTMITNPNAPVIPERLRRLPELANDLWWTWNAAAREVFRRLDYALWRQTAHNPVRMLRSITTEQLEAFCRNEDNLKVYDAAIEALDRARGAHDTWWQHQYAGEQGRSRISRQSSRCINRCPSTPAAWASWPAITARKRATSACR